MIVIACPKPKTPSGGVWFLYRLTELLTELGHDALLVQTEPFEPWWFDVSREKVNYTPSSTSIGPNDTLIIPEVLWPQPPRIQAEGARKILFVQNYIWLGSETYFRNPGEVMTCSRFLSNHMERVFKAKVIGKVTPFLDDGIWEPTPKQKDRTLLMARRNDYHAMMKQALEREGFPVEYVTEPLTQRQLSAKLRDCEFYVHMTHPEGFPMACLEAMRSGTIVVGTTGGGGNEFMFNRETAMVVQDPDNGHYGSGQEFVNRVLEQMHKLREDHQLRADLWQQAHAWSLNYTRERTKSELEEIFGHASA